MHRPRVFLGMTAGIRCVFCRFAPECRRFEMGETPAFGGILRQVYPGEDF